MEKYYEHGNMSEVQKFANRMAEIELKKLYYNNEKSRLELCYIEFDRPKMDKNLEDLLKKIVPIRTIPNSDTWTKCYEDVDDIFNLEKNKEFIEKTACEYMNKTAGRALGHMLSKDPKSVYKLFKNSIGGSNDK
jgi:hypothetical protein